MSLHNLVKHEWPKNQRNSPCSTKKPTNHNILLSYISTNVSVAYDVFYAIRLRAQIYLSKCSKCPPLAFTQARRRSRHWRMAASMVDSFSQTAAMHSRSSSMFLMGCWYTRSWTIGYKSYSLPDLKPGCSAATETEKWNRKLPFPAAQQ